MRIAVSRWLKLGPLAGFVFGTLTAATAAGALASSEDAPVGPAASPYGAYLAGRHAQEEEALWGRSIVVRTGVARRSPIAGIDQPHLSDGGQ